MPGQQQAVVRNQQPRLQGQQQAVSQAPQQWQHPRAPSGLAGAQLKPLGSDRSQGPSGSAQQQPVSSHSAPRPTQQGDPSGVQAQAQARLDLQAAHSFSGCAVTHTVCVMQHFPPGHPKADRLSQQGPGLCQGNLQAPRKCLPPHFRISPAAWQPATRSQQPSGLPSRNWNQGLLPCTHPAAAWPLRLGQTLIGMPAIRQGVPARLTAEGPSHTKARPMVTARLISKVHTAQWLPESMQHTVPTTPDGSSAIVSGLRLCVNVSIQELPACCA